jgi:hypothetical protein
MVSAPVVPGVGAPAPPVQVVVLLLPVLAVVVPLSVLAVAVSMPAPPVQVVVLLLPVAAAPEVRRLAPVAAEAAG